MRSSSLACTPLLTSASPQQQWHASANTAWSMGSCQQRSPTHVQSHTKSHTTAHTHKQAHFKMMYLAPEWGSLTPLLPFQSVCVLIPHSFFHPLCLIPSMPITLPHSHCNTVFVKHFCDIKVLKRLILPQVFAHSFRDQEPGRGQMEGKRKVWRMAEKKTGERGKRLVGG